MDEEISTLEENRTFNLTQLPPGKRTAGSRWVCALKKDIEGSEKYKARFVTNDTVKNQALTIKRHFYPQLR